MEENNFTLSARTPFPYNTNKRSGMEKPEENDKVPKKDTRSDEARAGSCALILSTTNRFHDILPGRLLPKNISSDISSLPIILNAAQRLAWDCVESNGDPGWIVRGMSAIRFYPRLPSSSSLPPLFSKPPTSPILKSYLTRS